MKAAHFVAILKSEHASFQVFVNVVKNDKGEFLTINVNLPGIRLSGFLNEVESPKTRQTGSGGTSTTTHTGSIRYDAPRPAQAPATDGEKPKHGLHVAAVTNTGGDAF